MAVASTPRPQQTYHPVLEVRGHVPTASYADARAPQQMPQEYVGGRMEQGAPHSSYNRESVQPQAPYAQGNPSDGPTCHEQPYSSALMFSGTVRHDAPRTATLAMAPITLDAPGSSVYVHLPELPKAPNVTSPPGAPVTTAKETNEEGKEKNCHCCSGCSCCCKQPCCCKSSCCCSCGCSFRHREGGHGGSLLPAPCCLYHSLLQQEEQRGAVSRLRCSYGIPPRVVGRRPYGSQEPSPCVFVPTLPRRRRTPREDKKISETTVAAAPRTTGPSSSTTTAPSTTSSSTSTSSVSPRYRRRRHKAEAQERVGPEHTRFSSKHKRHRRAKRRHHREAKMAPARPEESSTIAIQQPTEQTTHPLYTSSYTYSPSPLPVQTPIEQTTYPQYTSVYIHPSSPQPAQQLKGPSLPLREVVFLAPSTDIKSSSAVPQYGSRPDICQDAVWTSPQGLAPIERNGYTEMSPTFQRSQQLPGSSFTPSTTQQFPRATTFQGPPSPLDRYQYSPYYSADARLLESETQRRTLYNGRGVTGHQAAAGDTVSGWPHDKARAFATSDVAGPLQKQRQPTQGAPEYLRSPPAVVRSPPAAVSAPPAVVRSPRAVVSSPPATVSSPRIASPRHAQLPDRGLRRAPERYDLSRMGPRTEAARELTKRGSRIAATYAPSRKDTIDNAVPPRLVYESARDPPTPEHNNEHTIQSGMSFGKEASRAVFTKPTDSRQNQATYSLDNQNQIAVQQLTDAVKENTRVIQQFCAIKEKQSEVPSARQLVTSPLGYTTHVSYPYSQAFAKNQFESPGSYNASWGFAPSPLLQYPSPQITVDQSQQKRTLPSSQQIAQTPLPQPVTTSLGR